MAGIALAAAGIGAATQIIGGIFGNKKAKRQAKAAAAEKKRINRAITLFENNRQDVINPYSDVKSLAGFAKDLSGELSNPYADLGVATSAAEIKMEQTDLALAATLDTLQATGASAGGATALANAAARSKKDVAASIEQQEAQNEKLRAQGESQLERLQMQEAQRVQSIGMSEAQRLQQADIAGKTFMFENRERRQTEQLNRKQAQITNQAQAAVAASQGASALYSAGMSSFGNIAAAYAGNTGIANVELDRDGDPSTPY